MYNRAEVVDKRFRQCVLDRELPPARTQFSFSDAGMTKGEVIDLFETQIISRLLDLRARELKNKNLCYYTIGSSGHEGNAAVAKAFRHTDIAFLHYRSGAFFIQRAKQLESSTAIYDLLLSFTASEEDPIAGGRHKVFGSRPLMIPPQTSTIASHLPKAVGAALSICRARDLKIKENCLEPDGVVLCSFGDASVNHSTAQGAINTAEWISYQNIPMPIVFVCEDNGLGISVNTPQGWIENSFRSRASLKYIQCDGLNLFDTVAKARQAEHYVRRLRRPVFLHVKTVRLLGHAGSDVESTYQSLKKIERAEWNDPLLHSARLILENQLMSSQEIVDLYEELRQQIYHVSEYVVTRPRLTNPKKVAEAITVNAHPRKMPERVPEEKRKNLFARDYDKMGQKHHMAKLINYALADTLLQYPNSLIFGEDVAQKGGVYHVTDGLHKKFGARRVFNSLLDEQAILGTAIGVAHNGFLPIPEIQFLAYVHNAEDQIRGEAATLAFFSQGQFTNPMVLRVAGLAYQKGFGGHFHNDNSLAVFRDIPGIIIACPSNGEDAVKMFRTCMKLAYEEGRVVVFIEPIALYMTKDLHGVGDKEWSFSYPAIEERTPLGEFATYGTGKDLTIISYGNGYYYSRQAAKVLEDEHKIKSKIIDLRWLSSIDYPRLAKELKTSKRILLVEECRRTGSLSEGVVMELNQQGVNQPMEVLAADDCFIPLGPAASSTLPSKDKIVASALSFLERTK